MQRTGGGMSVALSRCLSRPLVVVGVSLLSTCIGVTDGEKLLLSPPTVCVRCLSMMANGLASEASASEALTLLLRKPVLLLLWLLLGVVVALLLLLLLLLASVMVTLLLLLLVGEVTMVEGC